MPESLITESFDAEEAKRVFDEWATRNGYHYGKIRNIKIWLYQTPPFVTFQTSLSGSEFSGWYAFHVHKNGEVTRFKLKDPEFEGGC